MKDPRDKLFVHLKRPGATSVIAIENGVAWIPGDGVDPPTTKARPPSEVAERLDVYVASLTGYVSSNLSKAKGYIGPSDDGRTDP